MTRLLRVAIVAALTAASCNALGLAVQDQQVEQGKSEPSADQVIQRAIDAMGGAEAINRIESARYVYVADEAAGQLRHEHLVRNPNHLLARHGIGRNAYETATMAKGAGRFIV